MNPFDMIAAVAGLTAVFLVIVSWRWRRARPVLLPIGGVLAVIGGAAFWFVHRPLPFDERRALFAGIDYTREVRPDEPNVIHIVRIDLDTPGLSFGITPHTPTDGHDQAARTTSQFLTEFGFSLAVNADGFRPWWARGLFDYYPHEGDPVDVYGFTAAYGDVYTQGFAPGQQPRINISADNRVSFNDFDDPPYNAISGLHTLLVEGQPQPTGEDDYQAQRHPRTAIALDQSGRILLLIVVDGRQPNYSRGMRLAELTQVAIDYGAWQAINLDGGGSSTLVMAEEGGRPVALNAPIHSGIPGLERPIANHLGVRASPS